jgi:hypothetical protein
MKSVTVSKPIPKYLIYEKVFDKPIYYKNYQKIFDNYKEIEKIMGSSLLQSLLIARILRKLMRLLPEDSYELITNEAGLQFKENHWCSVDIGIYTHQALENIVIENKYATTPPSIVIEVDTKADLSQFTTSMDYYYNKTEALLKFGVKKVIWIFTDAKKVMIAEPEKDWIITNWQQDIHVIEKVYFNLSQLMANEEMFKKKIEK